NGVRRAHSTADRKRHAARQAAIAASGRPASYLQLAIEASAADTPFRENTYFVSLPRPDLPATVMSLPPFMAAINCGSSAAFSIQADLPRVNMEKLLFPTVTVTFDLSWSS